MSFFSEYYNYLPEISVETQTKLEILFEALVHEAMPAGMIGKSDSLELLWARHIVDSLLPLQLPEVVSTLQEGSIYDLGSGAGLPGLALALVFPQTRFYLVDVSEKRTLFAMRMKERLQLKNVEVIRTRIEEFSAGVYPKASAVLFRAFLKPLVALELSLHIFQRTEAQKGKVLYWRSRPFDSFRKGIDPVEKKELKAATVERLDVLGFLERKFITLNTPKLLENRGVYILNYRETTPGFPRSWKKIKKDTLLEQVL